MKGLIDEFFMVGLSIAFGIRVGRLGWSGTFFWLLSFFNASDDEKKAEKDEETEKDKPRSNEKT